MSLVSCFQCDLDIPHICYAGSPDARWGLHGGAIAAIESFERYRHAPPKANQFSKKLTRALKPRARRSRP
jgi:hypothetical protein